MFLDKMCSIYDVDIVTIDWEDTKSYFPVYQSIACDFYVPSNRYRSNNQAREFENETLEVVLEWDKTLVRRGMTIDLSTDMMEFWSYVIDSVFPYKDINWKIDNIVLKVSERDVGNLY